MGKMILLGIVTALISYLLGSLNFSFIFTKLFNNKDIRMIGSGNAGLTNVVRSTNAITAIFSLVGDFGKTILSAVIANIIFDACGYSDLSVLIAFWTGFFCVLGHVFPVFFKFKGGKGVLTASAMLVMISPSKPIIFIVCVLIFVAFVLLTKLVSVASIITVAAFPITVWCFYEPVVPDWSAEYTGFLMPFYIEQKYFLTVIAMFVPFIIILKHFPNIERILESTEKDFHFSHKKNAEQTVMPVSIETSQRNKLFVIKFLGIFIVASSFIQQLNPIKIHTNLRIPLINIFGQMSGLKSIFDTLAGGGFISSLMYYICYVTAVVGILAFSVLAIGLFITFINGSVLKKGLHICKIASIFIIIISVLTMAGIIVFNTGIYSLTSFSFRLRVPLASVINLFFSILILKLCLSIKKSEHTA